MKRIMAMATTALLLAGCASSGTHGGMVYRDGAWYSPAAAGRGDYYTSTRYDTGPYDPWAYGFGYGYGYSPFGYCPIQYVYCNSFWSYPYYLPYGYGYGHGHHGHGGWHDHDDGHHARDRHQPGIPPMADGDGGGPGSERMRQPHPSVHAPRGESRPQTSRGHGRRAVGVDGGGD